MAKNKKSAFTLIELLVTITIIAIIAFLAFAFISKARNRARDAQRKSDLQQIKAALELYRNVYNQYPLHNTNSQIVACGTLPAAVACKWGEAWTRGTMNYMKKLGKDPLASKSYNYRQISSEDFCLSAGMEMNDDEAIVNSQQQCSECSVDSAEYVVCSD